MSKGYQAYADALTNSGPGAENSAVLQHIGLVHKTALHIKARLPDHVELEELVQIGMVGLLEAAKTFDSSQGATWAPSLANALGAILDEVRKRSPLSRTDSSHIKAEEQVVEQFPQTRQATNSERNCKRTRHILMSTKSNEADRRSFARRLWTT